MEGLQCSECERDFPSDADGETMTEMFDGEYPVDIWICRDCYNDMLAEAQANAEREMINHDDIWPI